MFTYDVMLIPFMEIATSAAARVEREEEKELLEMGADGEGGGFGWCNVFIKFLLFLTNVVIWVGPR